MSALPKYPRVDDSTGSNKGYLAGKEEAEQVGSHIQRLSGHGYETFHILHTSYRSKVQQAIAKDVEEGKGKSWLSHPCHFSLFQTGGEER